MRGHLRKRGQKWSVVVDVGTDEHGKRRQKWHSGYLTRREAEAALAKLLGQVQDGTYVAPSRRTVASYLRDEWLPAIGATVRPLTYESYERGVRNHLARELGRVPLQGLTAADVNGAYGRLLERLAPSTVRQLHAILHRALGDAARWGFVARNVADFADPPRMSAISGALRTWTADELHRFLVAAEGHRLHALYHVLASTGMRRGEAIGALWQDVDLETRAWSVRRTLVPAKGGSMDSQPKTGKGQRSVALDLGTVRVLREHRKRQLEDRMAWGPAWRESGRLFIHEDGTDLVPERVTETFDALVKRAKLPRIRLHDLRHTHATLALRAGVHPKVVQERLGHASIKVTLDTYSHAIPAMQEDAAAKVAALVSGP